MNDVVAKTPQQKELDRQKQVFFSSEYFSLLLRELWNRSKGVSSVKTFGSAFFLLRRRFCFLLEIWQRLRSQIWVGWSSKRPMFKSMLPIKGQKMKQPQTINFRSSHIRALPIRRTYLQNFHAAICTGRILMRNFGLGVSKVPKMEAKTPNLKVQLAQWILSVAGISLEVKRSSRKRGLTDPAQGIFRSPFLERLFPTFPATWCNLCWGKTSRTALSHGTIGPEPHGRRMLIPLSTPRVRSHQSWLVYHSISNSHSNLCWWGLRLAFPIFFANAGGVTPVLQLVQSTSHPKKINRWMFQHHLHQELQWRCCRKTYFCDLERQSLNVRSRAVMAVR